MDSATDLVYFLSRLVAMIHIFCALMTFRPAARRMMKRSLFKRALALATHQAQAPSTASVSLTDGKPQSDSLSDQNDIGHAPCRRPILDNLVGVLAMVR